MNICSLASVSCSRLFSVKQHNLKFTSFCVNILITVLFRVLKIKINLVKLTFWTAISSHQVMGMSLTKVWVLIFTRQLCHSYTMGFPPLYLLYQL